MDLVLSIYVEFLLIGTSFSATVYTWNDGACRGGAIHLFNSLEPCVANCTADPNCLMMRYDANDCRTQKKTCKASELKGGLLGINSYTKRDISLPASGVSLQSIIDNIALAKDTGQMKSLEETSDKFKTYSSKAVDGIRNPNARARSCSVVEKTGNIGYHWWYVDLRDNYTVDAVQITNRKDKGLPRDRPGYMWRAGECQGGLIKVETGNHTADECMTVCDGKPACINIRYNQYSQECRTQSAICVDTVNPIYNSGPGNINAFSKYTYPAKKTYQSVQSTYDSRAYRKNTAQMQTISRMWAYKAVDGDRNPNIGAQSCAVVNRTGSIGYHWWYVDLGSDQNVQAVQITNRRDAGAPRARNFQIWINAKFSHSDVYKYNNCLCAVQDSTTPGPGETILYTCQRKCIGRYVIIFKQPSDDEHMSLCEVEVFDEHRLDNLAINKEALHEPVDDATTGFPNLAADGSPAPVFAGGSASKTRASDSAIYWWVVDLERDYRIVKVVIYASKELVVDKYAVRVSAERPRSHTHDAAVCMQDDGTIAVETHVEIFCDEYTEGRYVQVVKTSTAALSLAEVEVYGHIPDVNRAFKKPTELVTSAAGSENAVDGRLNNHLASGSCIATAAGSDPGWWSVDLQMTYEVTWVLIVNRAATTELKDFKIMTAMTFDSGSFASTNFEFCHNQTTLIPLNHAKKIVCARPLVARYVIVSKTPTTAGKVLSFCEFEVYGPLHDANLAIGKSTEQSSTYWRYSSELAVDGKKDTLLEDLSCSQTVASNKGGSWWSVDLGADYNIYKVQLTNADKCCETCLRLFRVLVTKTFNSADFASNTFTQCHDQSAQLAEAEIKTIFCEQTIVGRYVIVTTSGSYPLTICEVKVYEMNRLENVALRKVAAQSGNSHSHTGAADLAVDGRSLATFSERSCSMSCGTGPLEYWKVDLGQRHRVYVVSLLARADKGGYLKDMEVNVAEKFDLATIDSQLMTQCHKQSNDMAKGERKVIHCFDTALGQDVVVMKHRSSFIPIVLCEVEVYALPVSAMAVNLARGKTTSQIATFTAGKTTSDLAVDGKTHHYYHQMSCAMTDGAAAKDWWQVDLGEKHMIEKVGLVTKAPTDPTYKCEVTTTAGKKGSGDVIQVIDSSNQNKCKFACQSASYCAVADFQTATSKCRFYKHSETALATSAGYEAYTKACTFTAATDKLSELRDFTVTLTSTFVAGGSASVPVIQCVQQTSPVIPGEVKGVTCPERSFGRHVVVEKSVTNNDPLALCEVEVFGSPATEPNQLTNATGAMQSSIGTPNQNKVIDGNMNPVVAGGSCTSTASGRNDAEWWAVYMRDSYKVHDVVLVSPSVDGAKLTNLTVIVAENFEPDSLNDLFANTYVPGLFKGVAPAPNGFSTLFTYCKKNYLVPNAGNGRIVPIPCDAGASGSTLIIVKHGAMADPLVVCEAEVHGTYIHPSDVVRTTEPPSTLTPTQTETTTVGSNGAIVRVTMTTVLSVLFSALILH